MSRAHAALLTALLIAVLAGTATAGAPGARVLAVVAPTGAAEATTPRIELFGRADCPRCVEAHAFVEELAREHPALVVVYRDVGRDPDARTRLATLAAERGIGLLGVPAFLVRGQLILGYRSADTTGREIRSLLEGHAPLAGRRGEPVCPPGETPCSPTPASDETLVAPLLGPLDARTLGLPLFTIAVGLVDGLNPCAMWLLLLLLSLLAGLRDRRRMVIVAVTFVTVSGLVYFAFMAAWLNVFLLVGAGRATEVVLGAVAVAVGALNVKDFIAFRQGPSLGIPASAKPGLYARARRVLRAERLGSALVAVTVLALVVNAVELLCTAGLPAVYTRILTLRELPTWQYYAYLALYGAAYVFDDGAMVALAVVTLHRLKLTERAGRWLKLVSGSVMVLLGIVLLVAPGWLMPR